MTVSHVFGLRLAAQPCAVRCVTLTAVESPAAFTVPFATGSEQVTFVYEPGDGDTGSATLNRFRLPQGVLLLVR